MPEVKQLSATPEGRVNRIEIHHEGGMIEYADGDDADKIWQWLAHSQCMAFIHGSVYNGPTLKTREVEEQPWLP